MTHPKYKYGIASDTTGARGQQGGRIIGEAFPATDERLEPGWLRNALGDTQTKLTTISWTSDDNWVLAADIPWALIEAWGAGGGSTQNVGAGGGGAYTRRVIRGIEARTYFVQCGISAINTDGEDSFIRALDVEADPDLGIISLYKLDETAGLVAADAIGGHDANHDNNGNVIIDQAAQVGRGVKYGDGVANGNFNTTTIPDNSDHNFERTDPFSLVFWINRIGGTGGNDHVLIQKYDTTNSIGWAANLANISAGDEVFFRLRGAGAANRIEVYTTASLTTGLKQVAITYDGSGAAAGVKIYFDGVEQALTVSNDNLTGSTINSADGRFGDVFESSEILLDEVSIHRVALTAAQVEQMRLEGVAGRSNADLWLAIAAGGKSGTNGGNGGAVADCLGDLSFAGGDGDQGTLNREGGGGAGDREASTGREGGERNGGQGGSSLQVAGVPGGGARSGQFTQEAGSRGWVRLTYFEPRASGYPTILGREWGRDETAGTTRTIKLPFSRTGELLLVLWASKQNDDGAGDHEMPAGWTRLTIGSQSTEITSAVFYKISDGAEADPTIATIDSVRGSWIVLRITGGNVPTGSTSNGDSTAATGGEHSVSTIAKRLWLSMCGLDLLEGSSEVRFTSTFDGNLGPVFGDIFYHQGKGADGESVALAVATAEHDDLLENPMNWEISPQSEWVAHTVEITSNEDPATQGELAQVLALLPNHRFQWQQGVTITSGDVTQLDDLIAGGGWQMDAPTANDPAWDDGGIVFNAFGSDLLRSNSASRLLDFSNQPFEWIWILGGGIPTFGMGATSAPRFWVDGTNEQASYNDLNNLSWSSTNPLVFSFGHDGADAFITEDEVIVASDTVALGNPFGSTSIEWGGFNGANFASFTMLECFVWVGRPLTVAERALVQAYALKRYPW